jgi:predicted PurR-regulated permease PerM
VSSIQNTVTSIQGTLSNVGNRVTTLEDTASKLDSRVSSLEGAATNITTSLALGGVALVLALISLALAFMKKK